MANARVHCQQVFKCSNEIEKYECETCPTFETHLLTALRGHIRDAHMNKSPEKDNLMCLKCSFVTNSKCLMRRHSSFCESVRSGNEKEKKFVCYRNDQTEFSSRSEPETLIQEERELKSGQCWNFEHLAAPVQYHKCDICPYRTTLTFRINSHRMKHRLPNKYRIFNCINVIESWRCFQCSNFRTYSLVHLKQHLKGSHTLVEPEEKLYECKKCTFQTLSNFLFLKHKFWKTCGKVNLTSIPQATLKFCSLENNRNSKGIENKNSKKETSKSNQESTFSTSQASLEVDILMQSQDSETVQWFECEHCFHKSSRKSDLRQHVYYMHGNKAKFKCDDCQFETKFKHSLKDHIMLKHTDAEMIKWFECEHCSFKSKLNSGLKRHTEYQHGNKANLKCAYCKFETKFKYSMQVHVVMKHTNPDKIQWIDCEHCSYKAKTKHALKRHVDSKHVEKETVKCDFCPFETKVKRSLESHILVKHTDPDKMQWFKCEHCPYKSKTKSTLKQHNGRKHCTEDDQKHCSKSKFKWYHCQL